LRPARAGELTSATQTLASARDVLGGFGRLDVEAAMTRVLESGHVLDSKLRIELTARGEALRATLVVERKATEPVRYRAEWRDGRVVAFDAGGPSEHVGPVAPREPKGVAALPPIGIGDLSVPDLAGLVLAVATGRARVQGTLAGLGSRPQVVVDVDLGRPEAAAGPVAGASGLLYLDARTGWMTALRVFDSGDGLVRVYGDLAYDASSPALRPTFLRADTLANRSHTRFAIGLWESKR
jgi:hypothetical protein